MTDFFTALPGETPAPVSDGPTLCGATDAMRRVHRVFLWAYAEAPGLARSASAGDTVRSAYVADVLRNFDKILHVDHEGEDLLMYPKLPERSPACALHVDQMLAHHAEVSAMLDELAPIRDEWGVTAVPALGETLAQHYYVGDRCQEASVRSRVVMRFS